MDNYIQLGIGWKDVRLGQHFDSIKEKLGYDKFQSGINRDGLEVHFDEQGVICSIRFWNYDYERQPFYGDDDFAAPEINNFIDFRTKEGINKSSSETDIIRKCGKPRKKFIVKDANGTLRYLCYANFDFVFSDDRLLNIGIFIKQPEIYKDVPDEITMQAEYWQNRLTKNK